MLKISIFMNMDIMKKSFLLFYITIVITLRTTHTGFLEDMEELEKVLEQPEGIGAQKKSLSEMSTEELIQELKRGVDKQGQKKYHSDKFHNILAKKEVTDDFEKLLAETNNKMVKTKTKVTTKSISKQQKIMDKEGKKKSERAKKKTFTHVKNETIRQMTAKNDPDVSLVHKTLAIMEKLRTTDVNDLAAQRKGLDLLQQLIDADKRASEKRSSRTIVEKIRIAKEDAKKRKLAKFLAALKADAALMKKLAEEKMKEHKKKEAEIIEKKKNPEKIQLQKEELRIQIEKEAEKTVKDSKKTVEKSNEEILDNKVIIKEGMLMDGVLNFMAEDLVSKITDNVAEKRGYYRKGHIDIQDTCDDKRTDCHRLVDLCEDYKEKLRNICAKSCRFCESCHDKWTGLLAHRCHIVVDQGMCPRQGAELYCRKSCGFCKIPIQPKCSKTRFGCCWDKTTIKLDPRGKNCKSCKDRYIFVCKRFKEECHSTNKAGKFMREYCPKTCDICGDTCRDRPGRAFYCPFWKKDLKWCDTRKQVMKYFCPATCGLC